MAAPKKVGVGVIGAGEISEIYLTNMTRTFSILNVVVVSDLIPERSAYRAQQFSLRQMTNEEIFNDPEIEIVVNLTNPWAHYEVTKQALLAGKHVYSEKMMAVRLEEGKELFNLSREKELLYTVAPDTFLGAGAQTVRKLIDSGMIGEVVSFNAVVTTSYQCCFEDNAYNPVHIFRAGGGIPFDMGGYYLHHLINCLGPIEKVCGFYDIRNAHRCYENPRHPFYGTYFEDGGENILASSLLMKSGVMGTFACVSETAGSTSVVTYHGTEGILQMHDPNYFSGEIHLQRKGSAPMLMPFTHGYQENSRGIGVADMAWALRRKRKPRLDAALGLHAFEAVHNILTSAKEERFIPMATTVERPEALPSGHTFWTAQERALDC